MVAPITPADSLHAIQGSKNLETGVAADAGTITGTEQVQVARSGLFQTTVSKIAAFANNLINPTNLPAPAALTGAELTAINQSGVLSKASVAALAAYGNGLVNPPALPGAAALTGNELAAINQAGTLSKSTLAALAAYSNSLVAPPALPNAATLTGTEILASSQGGTLAQSTLTTLGKWVVQALLGFTQLGTGATARALQDRLRDRVSVKDFGAKGDGVTNDSVAIQAAIDAAFAAGGGVVWFPKGNYVCNVVLKAGVTLDGGTGHFPYLVDGTFGPLYSVILTQAAAGFVVDTPSTYIRVCAVQGIAFQGLGAATAGGGVRFQNVRWGAIKRCSANNFADQGFQHLLGWGVVFEDILTTNVLLNRTRSAISGCVESFGTDAFLNRIEANPSLTVSGGVSSANLYCCGIVLGGANSFMTNCIGEDADRGLYVAPMVGAGHRISNCRFDSNVGYGVYNDGSALWGTTFAYNNSTAATGTYSGFYTSSTATGNIYMGCASNGTNSGQQQKYGFEDYVNNSIVNVRSTYFGCNGAYNASGLFLTQGFLGSGILAAPQAIRPADGTTVIDVTGTSLVIFAQYVTATSVTNFTGAGEGQTVRVLGSSKITIVYGSGTIVTATGANVVLANNTMYSFTLYNGIWYMG